MAEEQATTTNADVQAETSATPDVSTQLQSMAWNDTQPTQTTDAQQQAAPEKTPEATQTDDEIFDEADYLKDFGFESKEALKNELDSLRSNKPFDWKNDDSKKIAEYINEGKEDELYQFFDNKKKIEKLTTADLNANKNLAADLVKFGIKNDNKASNLTDDDIEFLFNQKYSIPQKPVQDDVETDTDYEVRVKNWEAHVANIERQMIIEAKIQQPKIAQLKSELVLPQIQREIQQPNQPTQEDLAARKQVQENFVQTMKPLVEKFEGVNISVKDKDVNYAVNYQPSKEEKDVLNAAFQKFSDSNFDVNALFAERWLNKDNTFNTAQMQKDLFRVIFGDKVENKLAVDSAGKRMDEYFKTKSNIKVNETTVNQTFNPANAQTQLDAVREQAFAV